MHFLVTNPRSMTVSVAGGYREGLEHSIDLGKIYHSKPKKDLTFVGVGASLIAWILSSVGLRPWAVMR